MKTAPCGVPFFLPGDLAPPLVQRPEPDRHGREKAAAGTIQEAVLARRDKVDMPAVGAFDLEKRHHALALPDAGAGCLLAMVDIGRSPKPLQDLRQPGLTGLDPLTFDGSGLRLHATEPAR